MKIIFVETSDYNTMLITDGETAIEISGFPHDGTFEDAKNWDISGIEGLETIEEVAAWLSREAEIFEFNEDEFESVQEIFCWGGK